MALRARTLALRGSLRFPRGPSSPKISPTVSALLSRRLSTLQAAPGAPASPQKPRKKKRSRLSTLPVLWPMPGVSAPPQLKPHEVARVQRLFRSESKLITSAGDSEREGELPEWKVPEIAFAGRSNVGKSSLLNAVAGQQALMRTSKTPGRTQQLHFVSVGGKVGSLPDLALVDMPGYGFASAAPKSVVDQWHQLVGGYVQTRRSDNLKALFLLIDARRGIQAVDADFMDFLHDQGMVYQVVFTKADAVRAMALSKGGCRARGLT